MAIPREVGGNVFEEKYGAKLEFLGGWGGGGANQKPSMGEGVWE